MSDDDLNRIYKGIAETQGYALAAISIHRAMCLRWAIDQKNPEKALHNLFETVSRSIDELENSSSPAVAHAARTVVDASLLAVLEAIKRWGSTSSDKHTPS